MKNLYECYLTCGDGNEWCLVMAASIAEAKEKAVGKYPAYEVYACEMICDASSIIE